MKLRIVVATCLLASPAIAAPTLDAFVATPDYQANLARVMGELPPAVFHRCPALVSNGSKVTVIEPVTFAPNGVPSAGLWEHSFPVSGCGNDTTINLYFRGTPGGTVSSIVGIPGDTRANLILQHDAVTYAMAALQGVAKGCDTIDIQDSKPVGPTSPHDVVWQENWRAAACGRHLVVPMSFVLDPTGATITASHAYATD